MTVEQFNNFCLYIILGICTNLFFIMVVSILSWYHWGDSMWIEQTVKERLLRKSNKVNNLKSKDAGLIN